MSDTYADLLAKLRQLDEITLMELLEISSEDIVNKFRDEIEDKLEDLFFKLADEQEED